MSITLDTLSIDLALDTTKFDAKLTQVTNKALQQAKAIEKAFSKAYGMGNPGAAIKPPSVNVVQSKNTECCAKLEAAMKSVASEIRNMASQQKAMQNKSVSQLNQLIDLTKKPAGKGIAALFKEAVGRQTLRNVGGAARLPFEGLNIGQKFKQEIAKGIQSGLNQAAQSFGLALEIEEGASRLSDALQRGFAEGTDQMISQFKSEILSNFGIVSSTPSTPATGRGGARTINNIYGRGRDVELVQNEIKNNARLQKQINAELQKELTTRKFQAANAKLGDIRQDQNATSQQILNLDPSSTDYRTKVTQLNRDLERFEVQAQQIERSDVFRKVEDLKARQADLSNEAQRLNQEMEEYQKVFEQTFPDLENLSSRQLQNALVKANKALEAASDKMQGAKPLAQQVAKYNNLIDKSQKVLLKQQLDLEGAQSKKRVAFSQFVNAQVRIDQGDDSQEAKENLDKLAAQLAAADEYVAQQAKNLNQTKRDIQALEQARNATGTAFADQGFLDAERQLDEAKRNQQLLKLELKRRTKKLPRLLQDLNSVIGLNLRDIDLAPDFQEITEADGPAEFKGTAETVKAAYNIRNNQIKMSAKALEEASKDIQHASLDTIKTLAHEMTHAIQYNFGKDIDAIKAGIKKPKLVNDLAKLTKKEMIEVGEMVKRYRNAGMDAVTIMTEIDAYISGIRAVEKAKQQKRVGKTPEILKRLDTQIKQGTSSGEATIKNAALKALQDGNEEQAKRLLTIKKVLQLSLAKAAQSLGKFDALSVTQGLSDPEGFTRDFEKELSAYGEYRKQLAKVAKQIAAGEDVEIPDFDPQVQAASAKKVSAMESTKQKVSSLSDVIAQLGAVSESTATALDKYRTEISSQLIDTDDTPLSPTSKLSTEQAKKEQSSNLAMVAANKLGKSALDATRAIYGFASGVEKVTLGLIPFGNTAKNVTQTLLPIAAAGAATLAIPGAAGVVGGAISGAEALLLPAFQAGGQLLGAGVEAGVINAVNLLGGSISGAIAESVPVLGGALGQGIAGALPEIGATLGSAAGAATAGGVVAAGGAATVAVPAVMASQAVNKMVGGAVTKALAPASEAAMAGEKFGQTMSMGALAVADMTRKLKLIETTITPLKQLDKLPKAQKLLQSDKAVKALAAQAQELNVAIAATKGDAQQTSQLARMKATVVKKLKAYAKRIEKAGGTAPDIEVLSMAQVRAKQAGQKSVDALEVLDLGSGKTTKEGENFVEGFTNQVASEFNTVMNVTEQMGEQAVKGLKKGIDSASPSKETEDEGGNFVQGFILMLKKRLGDVAFAAKLMGSRAVDALSDSLDFDLTALGQTGSDIKERLGQIGAYAQGYFNPQQIARDRLYNEGSAQTNYSELIDRAQLNMARTDVAMNRVDQQLFNTGDLENAGEAIGQGARKSYDNLKQLISQFSIGSQKGAAFFGAIKTGFFDSGQGAKKAGAEIAAFATAAALIIFADNIKQAVVALARLQIQVEAVQRQLQAVGFQAGTNIFKEFGDDAAAAGMKVTDFARSFAQMEASMRGKVGNSREMFGELTEGLFARGVTGDAQNRALTALQQMSAKGVVSMEELRQQLSEALPGAFTIAADAMGMSERQLMSLVSSGQLMTAEFLPLFIQELQVSGESISTLTSELNGLQNTFQETGASIASMLPMKEVIGGVNTVLKESNAIIQPLVAVALPLAGALIINLAVQAIKAALAIKAVNAAMLTTVKFSGAIAGVTVAVLAFKSAWDQVTISSNKAIKDMVGDVDKLMAKMSQLDQSLPDQEYQAEMDIFSKIGDATVGQALRNIPGMGDFFGTTAERFEADAARKLEQGVGKAFEIQMKLLPELDDQSLAELEAELKPLRERSIELTETVANYDVLGLSKEERAAAAKENAELTAEIEKRVQESTNLDTLQSLKKVYARQRQLAEEELAKGGSRAKFQVTLDEININEKAVTDAINKVKEVMIQASPTIQLRIEAEAEAETLQRNVEAQNIQEQISLYKTLTNLKQSERGAEAANRKLASRARDRESLALRANNESIKKQLATMSLVQRRRLENQMGTSVDQAGITDIARGRRALQVEGGDKRLEEFYAALETYASNIEGLNQNAADAAKEAYETMRILKDLNTEMDQLDLTRRQKALEARELGLQGERQFGIGGVSDKEFNLNRQIAQEAMQLQDTLLSTSRGFDDMVRGIDDFTYGLSNATAELRDRMRQLGGEIAKIDLSGMSTFLSAAGIEDIFGFDKITALIQKSMDIRLGDQRPQLQRQAQNEQRSFDRQVEDFSRQRTDLNRNVERSVFELTNKIQEVARNAKFDAEETALSFDRFLLQREQLQMDVSATNRQIVGANQAAGTYGVNRRVQQANVQLPSLELFEQNPEAAVAQLQAQYAELQSISQNGINLLRQAQQKGNAEISRGLAETRDVYQEKQAALNETIQLEGEKVAALNRNLSKEIEGTLFAIPQRLSQQAASLATKAAQIQKDITNIFTGAGITRSVGLFEASVRDSITAQVEGKLTELQNTREQLEELRDQYIGSNAQIDLGKMINESGALSQMDAGMREQLMRGLSDPKVQGNIEKTDAILLDLIRQLNVASSDLKENKSAVIDNTVALATRAEKRQVQDVDVEIARQRLENQFQSNPFLSDRDRQLADINLAEQVAEMEMARKVEDAISAGMPVEYVIELQRRLQELNELEFDQLKQQAQAFTPLLETLATSLRSSLGEAFKSFFDGSKNGFEALRDMAISVLDSIASKAAEIAASELISSVVGGLFGGGGAAKGILSIFGANRGGMVNSYKGGGMVNSYNLGGIASALAKESGTPVLAALHAGEQVLTDLNGDAQYFRKLKASGQWDRMKGSNVGTYNYGGMVKSYNNGGTVQNRATENKYSKMQGGNTTVVMNISTPDEGGFRRNEKQLLRRQQDMMKRAQRRYG